MSQESPEIASSGVEPADAVKDDLSCSVGVGDETVWLSIRLQRLDLSYNEFTALPNFVAVLVFLKYLDISHNHLTDLGAVCRGCVRLVSRRPQPLLSLSLSLSLSLCVFLFFFCMVRTLCLSA